jgi:hypothetical protein
MIALGIAAAAVGVLTCLRIGVIAEYDEGELTLNARVGFVRLRLIPPPRGRGAGGRKRGRGADALKALPDIVPGALRTLGRLRRKLLVKRLVVSYSVPGADDPASAAIAFAVASACAAPLVGLIDGAFRVKRREVTAGLDFCASEPRVYINAAVSVALWELVYAAAALAPAIRSRAARRLDAR